MKTYLNFFSLAFIAAILFASCSRTRDAIGLDTVYNQVKTGRWVIFERDVYTPPSASTGVHTDLLGDGQYLKFESNGVARIYNGDGTQTTTSHTYSFTDTKTMVLDGDTYKITENLVGAFNKMTLTNEGTLSKTVYTIQR